MTLDELMDTLRQRRALIVHCSRPGKGDIPDSDPVFPEDLRRAMDGAARVTGGLSCSLVWPDHSKTFGSVGIILQPRSTASISEVCFEDAGSSRAPLTGKRKSHAAYTVPFSAQSVEDTFLNATDYNEWIIDDADTVGIFVNLQELPLLVPRRTSVGGHPASPQPDGIGMSEILSTFHDLPVYGFVGPDIIHFGAAVYRP